MNPARTPLVETQDEVSDPFKVETTPTEPVPVPDAGVDPLAADPADEPRVTITSIASDTIHISVAAGEKSLKPGDKVEVSQSFAEQASYLPNVEIV